MATFLLLSFSVFVAAALAAFVTFSLIDETRARHSAVRVRSANAKVTSGRVSADSGGQIPDCITPIVAYRVWGWDGSGLKSLNGEPWFPRRPISAKCRIHGAPQMHCTCGIYALKHPAWLGWGEVHGEVSLWGTVVEHESGWRAQFAYPKRLVLSLPFGLLVRPLTSSKVAGGLTARNAERCLASLTAYGVDVYLADSKGEIRLWSARSGYDTDGLKRFRRTIFDLPAGQIHQQVALKRLLMNITSRRKRPPGGMPPPPALPVHSVPDIIRIIRSGRNTAPTEWIANGSCVDREICHG